VRDKLARIHVEQAVGNGDNRAGLTPIKPRRLVSLGGEQGNGRECVQQVADLFAARCPRHNLALGIVTTGMFGEFVKQLLHFNLFLLAPM